MLPLSSLYFTRCTSTFSFWDWQLKGSVNVILELLRMVWCQKYCISSQWFLLHELHSLDHPTDAFLSDYDVLLCVNLRNWIMYTIFHILLCIMLSFKKDMFLYVLQKTFFLYHSVIFYFFFLDTTEVLNFLILFSLVTVF